MKLGSESTDDVVECRNLVGGAWDPVPARERASVTSPSTGRVIGTVPMSGPDECARVVAAAKQAFLPWRNTPAKERASLLLSFRERLARNLDVLARSASAEAGKTVEEARAGLLKGIEVLDYAISLPNLDSGSAVTVSRGVSCEVRREPLGVVVGITPFNFPAMVPMWLYPIAIAVGNPFILKPSDKVPMTACKMGELMLDAGIPSGVFSIVHGGKEAVEALIDHPDVQAVAFVGSTAVARSVYARAAMHGKRALALGGAKNHLIVVPDADPNITVEGVVSSFTGCAGQRCMAGSTLIAVGDVDPLVSAIVDRASRVELGKNMGAIIDRAAVARLHGAIDRAIEEGARLRLDGRNAKAPEGCERGAWLGPTVIDDAQPSMECARNELFGPVLTIVRVHTLDEALALENASPYGNATSVFTTRGAVARYVAERASNGMIGVNVGVPVPREPFSFGGTKESRFGHGDITGAAAVEFWTQLKKITSKWALAPDANWMS